jgi:phosphoribosyl 1,2-cyclic phosphodiesterase
MKITFYGTRGSIPVADSDFLRYGGNTSCILVTFNNGRIAILDAGTGMRKLGNDILAKGIEQYDNIFIGLSHTHWDHIQGFPYFKPAYDPKRHFTIAICGKGKQEESLEHIFELQMRNAFFPVSVRKMGAKFTFWQPDLSCHTTASGIHVIAVQHGHPGGAYTYRINEGKKTLVYCTDIEYEDEIDTHIVSIAKYADLLIHDAQFSTDELKTRKGWGHSTWLQAIEVAERAEVKQVAFFHHDPDHNDGYLLEVERKCKERLPNSFFAREGMEIEI